MHIIRSFLITFSTVLAILLFTIISIELGHNMAQKAHYELANINKQETPAEQSSKSVPALYIDKGVSQRHGLGVEKYNQ